MHDSPGLESDGLPVGGIGKEHVTMDVKAEIESTHSGLGSLKIDSTCRYFRRNKGSCSFPDGAALVGAGEGVKLFRIFVMRSRTCLSQRSLELGVNGWRTMSPRMRTCLKRLDLWIRLRETDSVTFEGQLLPWCTSANTPGRFRADVLLLKMHSWTTVEKVMEQGDSKLIC